MLADDLWNRLNAGVGSLTGLLLVAFVSKLALGSGSGLPFLIAPLGAAAVILFAVPESPLARPWNVMGGNMLSAVVGVACAKTVADPALAAAMACGLSIALMMTTKCLHPPGGAVALTAVLGGPSIHAIGFGFAFWPVGLSAALLLATALVFKRFRDLPARLANR